MLAIHRLRPIGPLSSLANGLASQCASLQLFSSSNAAEQTTEKPKQARAANPKSFRLLFERRPVQDRRNPRGARNSHRPSLLRPPKISSKPRIPRASNPMFFKTSFLDKRRPGNFAIASKSQFRSVAKDHVRFHVAADRPRLGGGAVAAAAASADQKRLDGSDRVKRSAPRPPPFHDEIKTVADYLQSQGEWVYTTRPESTWIRIDNISPISSLEFMIKGIDAALDAEESRGIIDLDQKWEGEDKVQFLPPMIWIEKQPKWVRNARLILSPFSRPKGWFMQFDNRSIVNALITHAERTPIQCSYKRVKVSVCKVEPVEPTTDDDAAAVVPGPKEYRPVNEDPNSLLDATVSDHTIRVENCPAFATVMSIVNFFSRYDLKNDKESVKKWFARTTDGRIGKRTFLVHFAGADWARAALRERQSMFLPVFNAETNYDKAMGPMLLAQYPKQMW